MAYLKSILAKCRSCGKPAKVELIDRWNGSRGAYCTKCGNKALKQQQANEANG